MGRRRQLLGFGGAIDDVVERLAGNRPIDADKIRDPGDLGNAPATEVGNAEVAQLALPDQVCNGPHRFLQG